MQVACVYVTLHRFQRIFAMHEKLSTLYIGGAFYCLPNLYIIYSD